MDSRNSSSCLGSVWYGEREWNLKSLGFKFLFHMFGLRFLEKELETLRFQIWEGLEPPLLWGGSSFSHLRGT